ncbi:hypothetical protein EPN95_00230 [Patescibacteria group bacterium]|nr:MAG: hypothetical protein EPN95_00230 [Patescibacteria group bacterium]
MSHNTATQLIVFGRGLEIRGSSIKLSSASIGRVDALLAYITLHIDIFKVTPGLVVLSGGYAGASEGIEALPYKFREASLMLERIKCVTIEGRPISDYVSIYAEVESVSTLESVLNIYEKRYFKDTVFSARNPLGLVAHTTHLPRIEYFVCKILGLSSRYTQRIEAVNQDRTKSGMPEFIMYYITRVVLLGVRRHTTLRSREHLMTRIASLLRG